MFLENVQNTWLLQQNPGSGRPSAVLGSGPPPGSAGEGQAQPGSSGPLETMTTLKIRKTKVPKLQSTVHSLQFGKVGLCWAPGS